MSRNNTLTPITNDPDDNYDANFPFVNQEFLVNMMANILLDFDPPAPDHNIQNVLQESLNDKNPTKRVITEEEETKLKTMKFKHVLCKDENEICSITQDAFTDDDEVIQLPYNHCFHKDAILNWLTKEKGECPVCRYKFECVEVSVKIEETISSPRNNNNEIGLQYNDYTNYHNEFFILPSYLSNEPQIQYNNHAYFDFFRRGPSNDEENP